LARILVLVGGALLALFGSDVVGLPGSGALAVLVMAFVAGMGWRRQGWGDKNPVTDTLASSWIILQPLLFGLIGTEIQIQALDFSTVGWGVVVLCCGLIIRLIVSFCAVMLGDLNLKERIFVALAWLPKATVQAAIGPLALDKAKQTLATQFPSQDCTFLSEMELEAPLLGTIPGALNSTVESTLMEGESEALKTICNMIEYGDRVLTIAVLVILITAPIGAVAIMTGGPKLLQRKADEENETIEPIG